MINEDFTMFTSILMIQKWLSWNLLQLKSNDLVIFKRRQKENLTELCCDFVVFGVHLGFSFVLSFDFQIYYELLSTQRF